VGGVIYVGCCAYARGLGEIGMAIGVEYDGDVGKGMTGDNAGLLEVVLESGP
jgi:hypothetical protein